MSDGLQSNEFSTGCYHGLNGEMFFGGTNGLNAFFPENARDNPYVPPVAITGFRIFNKFVPIGTDSILKKAIPYVNSLTLPYRDNVFSFEFAALSYANSHKNRYRYKLDRFERGWNEVSSKQRVATYTNTFPRQICFSSRDRTAMAYGMNKGPRYPSSRLLGGIQCGFSALCSLFLTTLLWAATMALPASASSVRDDAGRARR